MMFNTQKSSNLKENKCYYRRRQGGPAEVRKIISIKDKRIKYKRLQGKTINRYGSEGECNYSTFLAWHDGEISEKADFRLLEGAILHPTYVVLGKDGEPVFRCTQRRAMHYLKKGYADRIDETTIRLNERSNTEQVLESLYGNVKDKPFFMAIKNDKCCVCGKTHNLTRHHVVPQRHLKKLGREVSSYLSNILFVCFECHMGYERHSELEPNSDVLDPVMHVLAWRDHFIETTKPKYLPEGWDIFTVSLDIVRGDAA